MTCANSSIVRGDLYVVTALALFGTYPLFLRLWPDIPAAAFLFAFQVVGAIALAPHALKNGFVFSRRQVLILVLFALSALLNDLCYFYAYRLTTIGNAALAHQLVSFFLIFLAPRLLNERTHGSELVALFISFAGIALIYAEDILINKSESILGITLGILSAFFYALVIIGYRYVGKTRMPLVSVNFWRFVIGTVLLIPLIVSEGGAGMSGSSLFPLVVFGLFFAVLATSIHAHGLGLTRPLRSSILGKTEPVFAMLYAGLFLSEVPSITTLVGGVFIIGSSIWLTLQTDSQREDETISN